MFSPDLLAVLSHDLRNVAKIIINKSFLEKMMWSYKMIASNMLSLTLTYTSMSKQVCHLEEVVRALTDLFLLIL